MLLRTPIPGNVSETLAAHRPAAPVDAWMRRTLDTLLAPADATQWPSPHRGKLWLMTAKGKTLDIVEYQ